MHVARVGGALWWLGWMGRWLNRWLFGYRWVRVSAIRKYINKLDHIKKHTLYIQLYNLLDISLAVVSVH